MAEKVTTMVLKVDLNCERCYKKIRRVLCKFPEIRDQVFDEKKNTVTITGPFCPERMKKKLCCKACGIIKSMEVKVPEKPKPIPPPPQPKPPKEPEPAPKPKEPEPAPKPKEPEPAPKPKEPEPAPKPKEPEPAPKPKPKEPEPAPKPKPKDPEPAPKKPEPVPQPTCPYPYPYPYPPIVICCGTCLMGHGGGPCYCHEGYPRPVSSEPVLPPTPKQPEPVLQPTNPPLGFCCDSCYHGHEGGPCYYGIPPSSYCGYGGNRRYVGRSDCFSEENPSSCMIM